MESGEAHLPHNGQLPPQKHIPQYGQLYFPIFGQNHPIFSYLEYCPPFGHHSINWTSFHHMENIIVPTVLQYSITIFTSTNQL